MGYFRYIARPRALKALFGLLEAGSPRSQRLVFTLFRQVADFVPPALMDRSLTEASGGSGKSSKEGWKGGLIEFLLYRAASAAGPQPGMDEIRLAEAASQTSRSDGSMACSEGLGIWNSRFGHGHARVVNAAECIALLRVLAKSGLWRATIRSRIVASLRAAIPLLSSVHVVHAESVSTDKAREGWKVTVLGKACAALGVLGGWVDCFTFWLRWYHA